MAFLEGNLKLIYMYIYQSFKNRYVYGKSNMIFQNVQNG